MPTQLFQRINLDLLMPEFRDPLFQLAANCKARGVDYWASFGYRSFAQQDQMHAAYLAGKGGKAAPAGLSAHNYGIAVDFIKNINFGADHLTPDWSTHSNDILGQEAEKLGFVWGAHFGDPPHVQYKGYVSGTELKPLLAVFNASAGPDLDRLSKVWDYIRAHHTL